MAKRENEYQAGLIKRIKSRFPGSIVLKNDPNYIQGFPDITIFHGDRWAVLECKRDSLAPHQPNQDYYVDTLNSMSYSAFVYPENEEEVFDGLAQAFGSDRQARVS